MLKRLFGKEKKEKITQVKIGGVKIGIAGIDETVEAVAKMGLTSDDELTRAIMERVQVQNYVPEASYDEYARDLLHFYKIKMGLPVEKQHYEPTPGLVEIKVLGPGCPRCNGLEKEVRSLLEEMNVPADLEKVEDVNEIAEYNVVTTPALIINGEVKAAGKVPRRGQIVRWIEEALT